MPFDFEYWAIWSYNRLRLLQPQAEERGLYKSGDQYLIHCPGLTPATKADDRKPLSDWFADNKQLMAPVTLVPALPPEVRRVRELTPVEMAACTGDSHTLRDVYADLAIELPLDFPPYYIQDGHGSIAVVTSRALDAEEDRRLRDTLERLKLAVHWTITTSPTPFKKADEFTRSPQADLDLLPARSSRARGMAPELSRLIRTDEEFWLEHRTRLSSPGASLLPSELAPGQARCLVNAATFPTADIRNHLSLYQRVAIVMPLQGSINQFYATAKVTEDEAIQLAQMGRLEFICPQAVDRYPARLLERLAAEAPSSLLLSRRLALATAAECRRRVPLLYPDLTMQERAALLRSLLKSAARNGEAKQRAMLEALIRDLGRIWGSTESMMHRRGAMANFALGIAMPASRLFQAAGFPDRTLELTASAMAVEWAAALGAVVQPTEAVSFSDRPHTEFLANLYSGLNRDALPRCEPSSNVRVSDILTVGRDVPVLDFARSFSNGDIDRLRSFIVRLSKHHYDAGEASAAVGSFNKEVAHYAQDSKRLERWDLMGLVLMASGTTGSPELTMGAGTVSLGIWVFARIKKLVEDGSLSEPAVVRWVDTTLAELYKTSADAVLVHRLKQRLNK